ncbi:MAG: AAA family ATPase [Akkermansiaceae bacterium]|nr:AAA family ATPase [Akkermansiaceae bacterium]
MALPSNQSNHRCRIVVTGGPGGGKTTAADMFRREIGERVVIVPEAATMMFTGGFPRYSEEHAVHAAQRAIYHVQRNLEDVQAAEYPGRILLCDRGTLDGAAYWPGPEEGFFEAMGTTLEGELSRYDGVIFFESAAVGGMGIEGGNPARCESIGEAAELDGRLRKIWSQHSNFRIVHHYNSFLKKITYGIAILEEMVTELLKR